MDTTANIIVQLLKVALGNSDNVNYDSSNVNWTKVIDFATNQGVLGVCFDAIDKVAHEYRPDIDNLMEWLGQTSYMETQYDQYEKAVLELSYLFAKHGLNMMVLKGYGCSLNYPIPNHRPCGDIDIAIYDKDNNLVSEKADRIIEAELDCKIKKSKISHHSHFSFKDYTVENHYEFSNSYYGDKISVLLEKELQKSGSQGHLLVNNKDVLVYLPSPEFNSLFLLWHLSDHFLKHEITLRMLVDWYMFKKKAAIGYDSNYEQFGLDRFNTAINHVMSYLFEARCELSTSERKLLDSVLKANDNEQKGVLKFYYNAWRYRLVSNSSCYTSFFRSIKVHLFHREDMIEN